MACLSLRGSVETFFTANAQPVPRTQTGLSLRDRNVSSAEAPRDRKGCGGGRGVTASVVFRGMVVVQARSDCGGGGGVGTEPGSVVWAWGLDV
eukprot:6183398-Pleurochrysis_carterae.AAC.1